jgi:hypothetical protein
MDVWYSWWSFGIYFPFWYVWTKKNLATQHCSHAFKWRTELTPFYNITSAEKPVLDSVEKGFFWSATHCASPPSQPSIFSDYEENHCPKLKYYQLIVEDVLSNGILD